MNDIRAHVLLQNDLVSQKEYQVTCKEGTFIVPDAQIAVLRKQEVHRMHPQDIGDGMSIPLVYPSHSFHNLSPEAIIAGMSVYQEYDETRDEWQTYLYKYAAGDNGRKILQKYLHSLGSSVEILIQKGFTNLSGSRSASSVFLSREHQIDEYIAYMIGLYVGYGKPKQIIDAQAVSRHVGLPLVGSIAQLYPQISTVWERLMAHGFFVVRSEQTQQLGSLIQLTLHDEEIVSYLSHLWFGGNKTFSHRYESLYEKISAFLGENKQKMGNSVLKFISK